MLKLRHRKLILLGVWLGLSVSCSTLVTSCRGKDAPEGEVCVKFVDDPILYCSETHGDGERQFNVLENKTERVSVNVDYFKALMDYCKLSQED